MHIFTETLSTNSVVWYTEHHQVPCPRARCYSYIEEGKGRTSNRSEKPDIAFRLVTAAKSHLCNQHSLIICHLN